MRERTVFQHALARHFSNENAVLKRAIKALFSEGKRALQNIANRRIRAASRS